MRLSEFTIQNLSLPPKFKVNFDIWWVSLHLFSYFCYASFGWKPFFANEGLTEKFVDDDEQNLSKLAIQKIFRAHVPQRGRRTRTWSGH